MYMRALQNTATLFLLTMALNTQAAPRIGEVSEATRAVAETYFNAYIARDWQVLEPLLAEDAVFTDPSAEPVFGKVELNGKQATVKNFRDNYAAITHMQFHKSRAFYFGAFAVFEGNLDWTLNLGHGQTRVTTGMPFISILRIEAGKVREHRDYADYHQFLEAGRKAAGN